MTLKTRRIAGIIIGVSGAAISVAHIVQALFASTPERYHGHEALIGIGFVLTVVGIMLLGTER